MVVVFAATVTVSNASQSTGKQAFAAIGGKILDGQIIGMPWSQVLRDGNQPRWEGDSPYTNKHVDPIEDLYAQVNDRDIYITTYKNEVVDHPVDAAAFVLECMTGFYLKGDERYLELARKNTDYYLDAATREGDELWFTYGFTHSRGELTMNVPWVSGMAQGMWLAILAQLGEATGQARYFEAAQSVLATFEVPPRYSAGLWFTNAVPCQHSDQQCLFFEEYPAEDPAQRSSVVNGHIYAVWGLADYYRITGEPLAGFLAQAGAAAVVDAFDSYRFPDHPSWYGITEFAHVTWENPESYHLGVTHQLKELNRMFGSEIYLDKAQILQSDYSQ